MNAPFPSLDERLTLIEQGLADVNHRLRAIEHGLPQAVAVTVAADSAHLELPRVDVVGTFALVGRAFVLFAGAYLLRALTESGFLNPFSGALLGLTYALALTAVAYRVAPLQPVSASFLGSCTVIISLPLLWEVTTRFAVVTPAASAGLLAATIGGVLAVAWRRDLRGLAWIATIGACLLGASLVVGANRPLPFTAVLIALGLATMWLGYDREWTGLRWIAAGFADFSVLVLVSRALATPPLDSPAAVIGILILLLVGYLGSIAIRSLVRKRDVLPFEAVQTAALMAIGLAGALMIAQRTGTGAVLLQLTLAPLAVASYAVAFMHREWHARARNYYFYTTLALVFALAGGARLMGNAPAGLVWALVALGMTWLARRYGRSTPQVHAIVYLLVGAWTTGLVTAIFAALLAPAGTAPVAVPATGWLVAAAVMVCWWMAAAGRPRTMISFFLVIVAAGAGVILTRPWLLPNVDAALEAPLLATTRTAIVAAVAVLVAWLGTRAPTREFRWLLYPTLGWGFLKLVIEDFRVSPPSLLFVALALYGGALIVAPRLAKRSTS